MRYSPTGPGRDKLKKAHLPPSHRVQSPGDENLAYKAQLQHYRQTKQKIIGNHFYNFVIYNLYLMLNQN